MRVYFDIMQKGELHLDDEGLEFDSLIEAYVFLLQGIRDVIAQGDHAHDVEEGDAVIDITDRGRQRIILSMTELLAPIVAPMRAAA